MYRQPQVVCLVRFLRKTMSTALVVVLCRQVLPAYWFGDWHWAAAHVLCLVGAVLGSIGSFAWQAHANSITEGGAPTWLVSSLPSQDPSSLNAMQGMLACVMCVILLQALAPISEL